MSTYFERGLARAMWFFFLIIGSGSKLALAADVIITNGGTLGGTSSMGFDVGQSFTATKTGRLTQIEVAASNNVAGTATLNIYSGAGNGGTLLYTKSGIDFSGVSAIVDPNVYNYTAITIDSEVDIVNGNVYTFVLTPNAAVDIGYVNSNNYAGGALFSADLGGFQNGNDIPFKITQSDPLYDSDGDLVASGSVSEPVAVDTTVDTVGEAVDVFDFTIIDGGGGDTLPLTASQLVLHVSGTSSNAERGQVTWRLNGPDASQVTGIYDNVTQTITFPGLSISIADGGNETYTVNAYFNNTSGLTEGHTVILSVDGDTDVTVGATDSHFGATTAVDNGTGTPINIVATKLTFTTQPAGSVSGTALTTQPVVAATDAFGNTDVDFSTNISLSEASAGTLSGTTSLAPTAGVATFTNIAYTASADQEAFTLTASATGLTDGTANSVTADVVATKLAFTTEPAPTTITSGANTAFSTVPVVKALDANNTVDTGYASDIVLSVTDPNDGIVDGTVDSLTGTGDNDGSGTTVTLTPSSGSATFSNLALQYTAGGAADAIALKATSGGLTAANSTTITTVSLPTVSNVSATNADGNYTTGNTLNIQIQFDQNVTVTGTPTLTLETGTTDEVASYVSGSGTSTLNFIYTVQAGDTSGDLDYVSTNALALNGGTIENGMGNAAVLTLPSPGAAGSLGANKAIVIDTSAPVISEVTPVPAITSDNTPAYTLSTTEGGTLHVGGSCGTSSATSIGAGSVTINLTNPNNSTALADGTYSDCSVSVTDTSGNVSNTLNLSSFTVDTTAPAQPVAPDLSAASDSGASNSDNITNITTPTFNGTAEANTTVALSSSLDGNLGSTTVDGSGNWSFTVSGALTQGNHNITAQAQDGAGNLSTVSAPLALTIDTTAPAAPSTPDLDAASDTGTSATDNITSDGTPTLIGTSDANVTITLTSDRDGVLGTTTADGSGDWSFTPSNVLSTNTHAITAKASDVAGNETTSAALSLTYDDTPPPLAGSSPANGDSGVALDTDLSLHFSEAVAAGSGNISLHRTSDNSLVETVAVGSAPVVINGQDVAIDLSTTLLSGQSYYVHIDAGAFTDTAGNGYAGINDSTSLRFTTVLVAPGAVDDLVSVNEDEASQIPVLDNDSAATGILAPASVLVTSPASHGMLSLNTGSGVLTYTPDADYNGSDSFQYTVRDSQGSVSNTATVSVNVQPVNDAPGAVSDVATTAADTPAIIAVLDNDSDKDSGDSLNPASLSVVLAPAHGSASIQAGSIIYTPATGYTGSDTFRYTVQDSHGATSNVASVYLNVGGGNAAPVANADSAATMEDSAVTIPVLSNDSDSDGSLVPGSVQVVAQPGHGSLSLDSGAGELHYTPTANYYGSDSFSYVVKDNGGATSNAASVSLTVSSVNDAPAAGDDIAVTSAGQAIAINVLGNDRDIDGSLAANSVSVTTAPSQGSVSVDAATGVITYTPGGGFAGSDSFNYTVKDNDGAISNVAQVSITSSTPNQAPLANGDSATTPEDSAVTIDLSGNDSDSDGGLATNAYQLAAQPAHGTVTLNGDGSASYTPAANFYGSDNFSYQAADNQGALSEAATVSVQVTPVNDPPTVSGTPPTTVNRGSLYQFTPTASDVESSSLSFSISNKPSWASFDPQTGTLSGIPGANDAGGYANIVISVSDGLASTTLPAFAISVTAENVPPVATADHYSVSEGGTLSIDAATGVLANDSDANGDALSVILVNGPSHGALSLNANGGFNYSHDGSETFSDSFSYRASDGSADSDTTTVTITITPVNDAPSFTSSAPSAPISTGSLFTYDVGFVDPDNVVTLSLVPGAPSWLSLRDNVLSGTAPATTGTATATLRLNDGQYTVDQTVNLNVVAAIQNLSFTTAWQGLPATVGNPVKLNITAHQTGSGPLRFTLDLSGISRTASLPGCSATGDRFDCSLTADANGQATTTLTVTPEEAGSLVVTLVGLDSSGQPLAASRTLTDLSASAKPVSQANTSFNLASATSLASIELVADDNKELVVGTSLGETVKLLDYDLGSSSATVLGELDNRGATRQVKVADIDRDGRDDILVLNDQGDATQVYYNQGGVSFRTDNRNIGQTYGREAELRDLDDDGYPELIIGASGFNLYVYQNHAGVFDQDPYVFTAPASVVHFALLKRTPASAPLSGSLVMSSSDAVYLVRFGLGAGAGVTGTPQPGKPRKLEATGASNTLAIPNITSLKVADLDGDGQEEIVVGNGYSDGSAEQTAVSILEPDNNGHLSVVTTLGSASTRQVDTGDFNGDGLLDLLVSKDNGTQQFYFGTGLLSNWQLQDSAIFLPAALVLPEDLNGDGKTDVLLYQDNGSSLNLFLSADDGHLGAQSDLVLTVTTTVTNNNQRIFQLNTTAHNRSGDTANNARLILSLPAGVSAISLPDNCQADGANQLVCSLGNLTSGQSIRLNLDLKASANVDGLVLTSSLHSDAAEKNATDNQNQVKLTGLFQEDSEQHHGGGGSPAWWLLLVAFGGGLLRRWRPRG